MWSDADLLPGPSLLDSGVLVRSGAVRVGERALTFEPSGEAALRLLSDGWTGVTAVARTPALPALLELERAAARLLPLQSARALLGLSAPGRRIWFLHHVQPALSAEVQAWWAVREPLVRRGVLTASGLERWTARLRPILAAALGTNGPSSATDPTRAAVIAGLRSTAPRLVLATWHHGTPRTVGGAAMLAGDVPLVERVDRLRHSLVAPDSPHFSWLVEGPAGPHARSPEWLTATPYAALSRAQGRLTVHTTGDAALSAAPESYDLVDLADLVHLTRPADRATLVARAARTLRPGGIAAWWRTDRAPHAIPGAVDRPDLAHLDRSPFWSGIQTLTVSPR